eukprot:6212026-Pleurochrysis_carterae.AAC.2
MSPYLRQFVRTCVHNCQAVQLVLLSLAMRHRLPGFRWISIDLPVLSNMLIAEEPRLNHAPQDQNVQTSVTASVTEETRTARRRAESRQCVLIRSVASARAGSQKNLRTWCGHLLRTNVAGAQMRCHANVNSIKQLLAICMTSQRCARVRSDEITDALRRNLRRILAAFVMD